MAVKNLFLMGAMALLVSGLTTQAQAQDEGGGMDDTDMLSLGVGYYDINDDDGAADFRLEYRDGHKYFWEVKPWAGAEVTSDTSIWLGGGVLLDLELAENFYAVPSFGAGFYEEGDSDKDLDYFLEFRSQIELAYEFQNQQRLGVAFGHISNAGLGDENPGTEILNLYYHVPVDGLF